MKRTLLALIIGAAIISASALAWQNSPPEKRDEQTISVNVDLVNVLFTVADKKGKFIPGLKREYFKVYEDGKPQSITNFSADTNLPLTIALLVDTSGSVRDRLRFEQEAAIEFFYSTLVRGKDRALVITFDSGIDLIQDYTDDPEKLSESIRTMRAAEVLESAQRNDVVIYTISTNSTALGGDRNNRGDRVLKTFADETGGKMFSPFKVQDLNSNFRNISEELRLQYALAYRPANLLRDGTFRRIRIEPGDKRHVVRARNGYYAPRSTGTADR